MSQLYQANVELHYKLMFPNVIYVLKLHRVEIAWLMLKTGAEQILVLTFRAVHGQVHIADLLPPPAH